VVHGIFRDDLVGPFVSDIRHAHHKPTIACWIHRPLSSSPPLSDSGSVPASSATHPSAPAPELCHPRAGHVNMRMDLLSPSSSRSSSPTLVGSPTPAQKSTNLKDFPLESPLFAPKPFDLCLTSPSPSSRSPSLETYSWTSSSAHPPSTPVLDYVDLEPRPTAYLSVPLLADNQSTTWIHTLNAHLSAIHTLSVLHASETSRSGLGSGALLHALRYTLLVRLSDTISKYGQDVGGWPEGDLAYVRQMTAEAERVRMGMFKGEESRPGWKVVEDRTKR
jgi:hypothetical protein